MKSTLRAGLIALAVLMLTSFGSYYWLDRKSGAWELLLFDLSTLAAYCVLVFVRSTKSPSLSKAATICFYLACIGPVLVGLVQSLILPATVRDSPALIYDNLILEVLFASAYFVVIGWLCWVAHSSPPDRKTRIAPWVASIGGLLVLSSLFLTITVTDSSSRSGAGWRVLDRQEQWVTAYASPGQNAFFGPTIKWLQPIFPITGYTFYTIAIVATLATLIVLLAFRLSSETLSASKTFSRLTALLSVAATWVLADIFWGWHFNFSDHAIPAVLATCAWLAMLMLSAEIAWRIARRDWNPELVIWLRLIQLPVISFNLMLIRVYFEHGSFVPLRGLAALLVGLTVLSWTCQSIVFSGKGSLPSIAVPRREEIVEVLVH